MPPIVLALILTFIAGYGLWEFSQQARRGRIETRMGTVDRRKSPRHFAAIKAISVWLLAPIAILMLIALWIAALSRTFE